MMKFILSLLTAFTFVISTSFSQCPSGNNLVTVEILTDNFGYETSWNLLSSAGTTLASGGEGGIYANNTNYTETICVPENTCMRFEITDDFGDGICCGFGQGSYTILIDGIEAVTGGSFTNNAVEVFNCPPGSSCTDALIITEGSHVAPNTNTWYSFTPAQNGTYAIEACNNACNTKLWIYEHCAGLVWLEDNTGTIYYDDDQGGCSPQAMVGAALLEGGNEYWIRIGSHNGDCTGSVNWSLTYNGPVTGCML